MIRRRLLALALSLALLLATAVPVSAGCGCLRWGEFTPMTSTHDTAPGVAPRCLTTVNVWLQELGVSGVTQLKARFQLRSPNDPGFPLIGVYQEQGWFESRVFPDDFNHYYRPFQVVFKTFIGGQYAIHAKFVGVRPGFWQRDRTIEVVLPGVAGCDHMPSGA